MKMRLQFSLRSMLLLVVAAAVALAIHERRTRRARAIATLTSHGAIVTDFAAEELSPDLAFAGPIGLDVIIGEEWRGGVSGVRQLSQLTDLASMSIRGRNDFVSEGLKAVANLDRLEYVGVGEARLTRSNLVHMCRLPHLKSIGLSRVSFSDVDALAELRSIPTLICLSITCSELGNDEAARLADLATLKELMLQRTLVDDAVSDCFPKRLQTLILDDTLVGDRVARLLASLDKLEVLSLNGTCITDEGLSELKRLPRLRYLHLARTSITDAGLVTLRSITSLEDLTLCRTSISKHGLSSLHGLNGLKRLEIDDSFGTECVRALRLAIPSLINITLVERASQARENVSEPSS